MAGRDREPAAGEVRSRVAYAAVNPTDIGLRQHRSDVSPPPWIPGMDAAGEVDRVGEGVDRLAPGRSGHCRLRPAADRRRGYGAATA